MSRTGQSTEEEAPAGERIAIERWPTGAIHVTHYKGEVFEAGYIAIGTESAMAVVQALLAGKEPPRDYRRAKALKTQKQPL